jgi:hypothetical protein
MTAELTRFPDGEGYLEHAWDGLSGPQVFALRFIGHPGMGKIRVDTLRVLRRNGLVTGDQRTPRGDDLIAWAKKTRRIS